MTRRKAALSMMTDYRRVLNFANTLIIFFLTEIPTAFTQPLSYQILSDSIFSRRLSDQHTEIFKPEGYQYTVSTGKDSLIAARREKALTFKRKKKKLIFYQYDLSVDKKSRLLKLNVSPGDSLVSAGWLSDSLIYYQVKPQIAPTYMVVWDPDNEQIVGRANPPYPTKLNFFAKQVYCSKGFDHWLWNYQTDTIIRSEHKFVNPHSLLGYSAEPSDQPLFWGKLYQNELDKANLPKYVLDLFFPLRQIWFTKNDFCLVWESNGRDNFIVSEFTPDGDRESKNLIYDGDSLSVRPVLLDSKTVYTSASGQYVYFYKVLSSRAIFYQYDRNEREFGRIYQQEIPENQQIKINGQADQIRLLVLSEDAPEIHTISPHDFFYHNGNKLYPDMPIQP